MSSIFPYPSNAWTENNENDVVVCSGRGYKGPGDEFVYRSPHASLSHLSCWQNIIARTYCHRTYYLMFRRDNEIQGVLPLIWLGRFFRNVLCSMPFLDSGGILALDHTSGSALLAKAVGLRDAFKARYLELRHKDAMEPVGTLRQDKADMVLDLSPGHDSLWQAIGPKVRNQVRKAMKSGLTTKLGGSEFLDDFYGVYAINMRDLGSPVHSAAFFANIFREFSGRARILIVCDGGKTVGALICLFYKDSVFVPWASSLRTYFPKCPNNILYWNAIQYSCENGCSYTYRHK